MTAELQSLVLALREFARERDWEQFHSPKNLASALCVEAGELLEHFQWLTEEGSRSLDDQKRLEVSSEIADVLIYLLQLSDRLAIDPVESAKIKLIDNAAKYPVDLARGSSKKYDQL